MQNEQKSPSARRRARLSLLLGFTLSFLPAVLFFTFGPFHFDRPCGVLRAIYTCVGIPVDILLFGMLPSHVILPSGIEDRIGANLGVIGGFLIWGLFFSSMIYGYLCNKDPMSDDSSRSQMTGNGQRARGLRLGVVSTLLFFSGVGLGAGTTVLGSYRAALMCGRCFSPSFSGHVIGDAATIGIPIILLVAFYWLFPAGKMGNFFTLPLAVVYAVASGHRFVTVFLSGLAFPSDLEPFFVGMFIFYLWMLLYGVSMVSESRPNP